MEIELQKKIAGVKDYRIQRSPIHRYGLFANRVFQNGEYLFRVYHPTEGWGSIGDLVNHQESRYCNTYFVHWGRELFLFASKKILPDSEITADYKQLIRKAPSLRNQVQFW